MSRGGKKNKKNNKKLNLSEGKFRNKICKNCSVCNSPTGSFCYKKYKEDPAGFLRVTVPLVTGLAGWPDAGPNTIYKERSLFTDVFCANRHCDGRVVGDDGECKCLDDCYNDFEGDVMATRLGLICAYSESYLTGKSSKLPNHGQGKKKKKKDKKTYNKPTPVPTFFCNDDAEWKVIIDREFNENPHSGENKDNESDG